MNSNKFILEKFIIMSKRIDYFLFKIKICDELEQNASMSIKS